MLRREKFFSPIFYIDFIENIDYLRLSIVLGQLLYRVSSNIFSMVIAVPAVQSAGEYHLIKKK
jgi:hypothetical protein